MVLRDIENPLFPARNIGILARGVKYIIPIQYTCQSTTRRQQPVTVSGVFICYNQQDFVRGALESMLAQTYPMDVIISDYRQHGSDVGSAA